MSEKRKLEILKNNGVEIQLGKQYSVKAQIAQIINAMDEYAQDKQFDPDGISRRLTYEELTEDEKNEYRAKAEDMVSGLILCNRFWSAWSVGTMTEDDFKCAESDDELIEEKAEELYKLINKSG